MKIIFDMDGVITSETGYWRAAARALQDLATFLGHPAFSPSPSRSQIALDLPTIARAKAALINTNWDLCHLAALILVRRLATHDPANGLRISAINWDTDGPPTPCDWPSDLAPDLDRLVAEGLDLAAPHRGFKLLAHLAPTDQFQRQGPVWQWLFRHFQTHFNGTPDRPGIIADESLILPPERIAATLRTLREAGHDLAIATGRTSAELLPTLTRFGLTDFFDPIVTHDEVAAAEAEHPGTHLSKPHPYPFLRAIFPHAETSPLLATNAPPQSPGTVIVGDTAGDLVAATAIGARPIGVLTGPAGPAARDTLNQAGAEHCLADVTELPAYLAASK